MPVCLNGITSRHDLLADTVGSARKPHALYPTWPARHIKIGLINNMPDAALEATERQFITLLDSAAGGIVVHLSFYALPDVPRSDSGRQRISRFYSSINNLWNSNLDGLIVTGREPQTQDLKDEPYWGSLTRVLEWAEDNTYSAVWSCLAAHAVLLHTEGIVRRRSSQKRCGVFECARQADHPLMAGLSSRLKMPHSRWNDIPEDELTACGYSVLTRAQDAGADTFIKRRNSLFVFFQGHPEYESDTLLLEYRRDVRRYLMAETDTYPSMPRNYFDRSTANALTALREKAMSAGREDLLADLTAALEGKSIAQTWRSTATCVYGNWLAYLCAQQERQLRQSSVATTAHR